MSDPTSSCLTTARACALGKIQYRACLHSIGGFLSTRSTAFTGDGWPTIPMLPVWSMMTRAKEPSPPPRVCQNGTVIEQSGVPLLGSAPHSVIHSSDRNVCSPVAGGRTSTWTESVRKKIPAIRKCRMCICGCLVVVAASTESEKPARARLPQRLSARGVSRAFRTSIYPGKLGSLRIAKSEGRVTNG